MKKSNIILIGFMGVGKTSVGKKVAEILDMEFVDTDLMIEKSVGMSARKIFSLYGEAFFREKEAQVIRDLANKMNAVLATGGGVVLNPINVEILSNMGIIVWLKAPLELIYERIQSDINRPLSYNKSIEDIKGIYFKRHDLYDKYCNFAIDISGRSIEETALQIVDLYKRTVDFCET